MQIDTKMIPAEVVKEAAIAVCEYALAGKRCPCRDSGIFACVNEYPGRMARAAIAAGLSAWPGIKLENLCSWVMDGPDLPYVEEAASIILPLTEKADG